MISRRLAAPAIVLAAAALLAGCGSSHPAASAPSTSSAPAVVYGTTPVPSTAPPAGPTKTRTVTRIVFKVRGDAGSGGADITYGSDSDNISPDGGLGFDGSGTAVPFEASVKYHRGALYYDISAQLQGDGDIRCSVSVKVTEHFSDGTHRTRSKVVAHGHASGGYNICDAQAEN